MLVGVNVVVQSVSLRGGGADGGEALPLCVSIGSLQPVVLSLKRDCGVFGLSTDPACLALLTQGSGVATSLSVLVLSSSSSQSVLGAGTVSTIELVNMSERDNYSSMHAPEPCLQLPSLLLSTALVTVPLVRSPGVATHLGTVTLRVAVFDMTKRAVDALCVFPTGRLAQRRLERQEESRSAGRALPSSLLSGRDEPSAEQNHHNYYGNDDDNEDVDEDEDDRGTDALLSSLEGILAVHKSTDSLRLSSILPPSLSFKAAAAAAAAAVSDSTLSLDVILAEMAAEEAKRREVQAQVQVQAQAQKGLKAGAAAARAANAATEKPRSNPKAIRPIAKAPSKQGKENNKPPAARVKTPTMKGLGGGGAGQAPPAAKAKGKGKGKSKGKVGVGPSRVTVLLKKGEVPPNETAAAAQPPAPPAPSKQQQVDSDFYTRLAAAVEGALDVSMVDAATAARVRERQLRASLSLPVRFKDTPLLVLNKCDPSASSPAALAAAAARERRAASEAARLAKAKAERKQQKLQRKGGTRETILRVDLGKLS